ncbi:hypothetical protein ACF3NG_10880 [Aerococcaceae bacterium WGS1372]
MISKEGEMTVSGAAVGFEFVASHLGFLITTETQSKVRTDQTY